VNDGRGILEEFVRACDGFRWVRGQRFDPTVSANLDPESRRMAYRAKHEEGGICRSCKRPAKPGRKYCETHLAQASARVKAGSMALRRRIEVLEEQVRSLQMALPRGIPQAAE
jgi:hypothetical protein